MLLWMYTLWNKLQIINNDKSKTHGICNFKSKRESSFCWDSYYSIKVIITTDGELDLYYNKSIFNPYNQHNILQSNINLTRL